MGVEPVDLDAWRRERKSRLKSALELVLAEAGSDDLDGAADRLVRMAVADPALARDLREAISQVLARESFTRRV
jgi:hypothetical protein